MTDYTLLNQLIDALAIGLNNIYPDIQIFKEDVPQSLPDKCFLIGFAGDCDIQKQPCNKFKISGKFDITYFSEANDLSLNAEFNTVFLSIFLNLQQISNNDFTLRLKKHKSNIVDDVLHILCDFEMFIISKDNIPTIENIEVRM